VQAVRVHTQGGPEVLAVEDVPVPQPQAGEVVVRIAAAGVNYIDTYQRSGLYQVQTPFTLGQEGAGTVDRVGDGVLGLAAGDRVAWTGPLGAYAELAVVPADRLVALPDVIGFDQAAAAMLQGMTAHYLAVTTFALEPGHTCLVHAAAGGVGLLLTQIAKARGATVYATVGSDEKAALAREAGADEIILYRTHDFLAAVRRLTDGRGVDVVYDGVGRETFDQSLECVRTRGILVMFGNASGAVPPFDLLRLTAGARYLTRPRLAEHIASRDDLVWRSGEVLGWIAAGRLGIRIHRKYPLADAAGAHRDLEARRTSGKLLLVPQ
jgi:NADPH2:quinone reductase